MRKTFKTLFVTTLPVLAGYVFLGFAFGLLMKTSGFPFWYPIALSFFVFSGALEFAVVGAMAGPFDPLGMFVLSIMLSARHLFYGIPMLEKYKESGKLKPFLIFGLTDETFSLLSTLDVPEGMTPNTFYMGVTYFNYAYWNIGTLLGTLIGGLVGFNIEGLDFALSALFIVLFIESIKNKSGVISGFTGLVVSLVVLLIFGSSNLVIISMVAIFVALLLEKKVITNE